MSEEEIEVGYIWYNINNAAAYLCDFYIYNDFRRKGYATHALANLELEVKQFGCNEIALNVFDYNTEAITLYEKCGYHLCSIVEAGCRYLIKQLN